MRNPGSAPDEGDVVEIEFTVTAAAAYPFVSIAEAEECRLVLEEQLPRADGLHAEYFSVVGGDADVVADALDGTANEATRRGARVLIDDDGRSLVEFVVGDDCPACFLAERGAILTRVEGTPDGGTIVAEIMPDDDPASVVDEFEAAHAVELVAKRVRSTPTPLHDEDELRELVLDRLTDRQREVLETAFEEGYYRRPRERSGEEIAAVLDISPTTFQEHIRAAERKLVTFLVAEED